MANLYFRDYIRISPFKKSKPTFAECINCFTAFLKQFPFFTEDDLNGLGKYFDYFSAKKNETILLPGEVCEYIIFTCKGAVKQVAKNENGLHIIELLPAGNFCTAINSFKTKRNTVVGFVCAQQTYGIKLSLENYEKLIKQRPNFEKLLNSTYEHGINHLIYRLTTFQSLDANGRYSNLLREQPDVFEKFTMNDIASYLGIKPETLSRLRKKIGAK
ncbi:MAG TPA: Crp/Fnr family transcriptional regulator [Chitinophagales bacterium]|nr:Crp/Fnr family transcriptional regulator [Chitinophagales bacterium]